MTCTFPASPIHFCMLACCSHYLSDSDMCIRPAFTETPLPSPSGPGSAHLVADLRCVWPCRALSSLPPCSW